MLVVKIFKFRKLILTIFSENYKFSKKRKGDVAVSYADNKRALKLLGWKPIYNYEDMVYDSWQAYLKNI